MMRCAVCTVFGPPESLQVAERPVPELQNGQILIKVYASSINRADTLQRRGLYAPPPGVTDIFGLDAVGKVEAIGPQCKKSWKVGDNVMTLVSGGGNAEYVAVLENHVIPAPTAMPLTDAAAIPEVWLTAYQLLRKVGRLEQNQTVLIHAGASGVGTAALQLVTKLYSGVVFATAGSEEKLQFLTDLGAQNVFNYKSGPFVEWVKEKTGGRGVDMILDCIGGDYFTQNAECIAMDGSWILYGLMGGPKTNDTALSYILRKRISIRGTTLRNRSDEYKTELMRDFAAEVLPHFNNGRLRPIVDQVFELEKIADAHRYMESNASIGKVILRVRSE